MNAIDKALTVFAGLAGHDPAAARQFVDPDRFIDHRPHAAGVDLTVIRSFQDGPYVVTQADGRIGDDGVFFDVFRFADGLIVEHWGYSAPAGPPNQSGHTQVDGPTEARSGEDTDKNKAIVRDYYEKVHIAGRHDAIPRYFSGDHCVRHEPGVADGVAAFMRDLEQLTRDRTIDKIELLLGEGDFVFLVAAGTHRSEPCLYIDLYRVENEKLVEHWGFPQAATP